MKGAGWGWGGEGEPAGPGSFMSWGESGGVQPADSGEARAGHGRAIPPFPPLWLLGENVAGDSGPRWRRADSIITTPPWVAGFPSTNCNRGMDSSRDIHRALLTTCLYRAGRFTQRVGDAIYARVLITLSAYRCIWRRCELYGSGAKRKRLDWPSIVEVVNEGIYLGGQLVSVNLGELVPAGPAGLATFDLGRVEVANGDAKTDTDVGGRGESIADRQRHGALGAGSDETLRYVVGGNDYFGIHKRKKPLSVVWLLVVPIMR